MECPPTIRILAQSAGVSKATVSLALRDSPRIRPEVRERIQRLAADAGYRPNALVANLLAQLRASKTSTFQSTLGLLCIARDQSVLQEVPTFRSWIAGCRARASEQGYGFDQFWVHDPGIPPARLVEILDARNIRGVAVVGFLEGGSIPRRFDPIWQRSAAVALGVRPTRPALHFAANDQYVTAAEAVRELIRLGYRRPGLCVNGHIDDIVENKFTGGFWVAQCRLPPAQRLPVFDFQPGGRERFARWLHKHRPDAILTVHRDIRDWVASLGLDVPGDIGLVHLDKTSDFEDWAGMDQNSELIGRAAMDMVIGQLHRNEACVPSFQKCMLINSTWSPGATVRRQTPSGRNIPRRMAAAGTCATHP